MSQCINWVGIFFSVGFDFGGKTMETYLGPKTQNIVFERGGRNEKSPRELRSRRLEK